MMETTLKAGRVGRHANSHGSAVIESHDFLSFLTVSRQGSQSHGFWGKIFLK